jgi:hypothetical protein
LTDLLALASIYVELRCHHHLGTTKGTAMAYTDDELNDIFDRTDGDCHICSGPLKFSHYGDIDSRHGWEVDHSVPRALGGTDRLSNRYAAHISCNRSKQAGSTRSARSLYGYTRAPDSLKKRQDVRAQKTLIGVGLAGGFALLFLASPAGAELLGQLKKAFGRGLQA